MIGEVAVYLVVKAEMTRGKGHVRVRNFATRALSVGRPAGLKWKPGRFASADEGEPLKERNGIAMETSASNPNAPWLTMLYMAGDNNLTEEMVLALQDLVAEGAPHGSKILAQFDPSGVGFETQRYIFDGPGHGSLEAHRDRSSIPPKSMPAVSRRWPISSDGRPATMWTARCGTCWCCRATVAARVRTSS